MKELTDLERKIVERRIKGHSFERIASELSLSHGLLAGMIHVLRSRGADAFQRSQLKASRIVRDWVYGVNR